MIGTNDVLCWVAESCNILVLLLHLQNTAQSRQCAKKSANTNLETMKVKFHSNIIIRTLGRSTAFGVQQRLHSQSQQYMTCLYVRATNLLFSFMGAQLQQKETDPAVARGPCNNAEMGP